MKQKRGQQVFGMSFGTIFSILLIIFFIVIAIIVINAFLKTQKCAEVGIFIDDFQIEIDKTWNSQKSEFEFESNLPSKLDYVCFANLSNNFQGNYADIGAEIGVYQGYDANLFLYPIENACDMVHHNIKHIDIDKITRFENPYCIGIDNGKISIKIEKDFNEALVSVS